MGFKCKLCIFTSEYETSIAQHMHLCHGIAFGKEKYYINLSVPDKVNGKNVLTDLSVLERNRKNTT